MSTRPLLAATPTQPSTVPEWLAIRDNTVFSGLESLLIQATLHILAELVLDGAVLARFHFSSVPPDGEVGKCAPDTALIGLLISDFVGFLLIIVGIRCRHLHPTRWDTVLLGAVGIGSCVPLGLSMSADVLPCVFACWKIALLLSLPALDWGYAVGHGNWRARRTSVHNDPRYSVSFRAFIHSTAQAHLWVNLVSLPASAVLGTWLTLGRRGFDLLLPVLAGQALVAAYVFAAILRSPGLKLAFSTNPFSLSAGAAVAIVLALFATMGWFMLNLLFSDGSDRPKEDFQLGGWLYFFAIPDAVLVLATTAYEKDTCR